MVADVMFAATLFPVIVSRAILPSEALTITYQLDCNSNSVVYFITCKVCGSQYVGSTSTKLERFNNHKSCLRAHSRKLAIDKKVMTLPLSIFMVLDIMD